MRQELPTAGQVVAGESETTTLFVLTDRLYRARSLQDGFDAALDAIVGSLGCERASILLFDDFGVMRFVAWRGLSEFQIYSLTARKLDITADNRSPTFEHIFGANWKPRWQTCGFTH